MCQSHTTFLEKVKKVSLPLCTLHLLGPRTASGYDLSPPEFPDHWAQSPSLRASNLPLWSEPGDTTDLNQLCPSPTACDPLPRLLPPPAHQTWISAVTGWIVTKKYICWSPNSLVPVTLFGNRTLANVIQLRLHLGWALVQNDWTRRGKRQVETEIHRDNAVWRQSQRLEWCSYKPRNARDCWPPSGARKRQGRILPRVSEGVWLLTTWFWTSCLQNCERINFCCFKSPKLW